ncbi:glycosyltransferase family 4 protein [Methylobacterium phyllosphaerae]
MINNAREILDQKHRMSRVVVFQNYFTPYRHALFEEMGKKGVHSTVVYLACPSREGRKWRPTEALHHEAILCKSLSIGPVVLFWPPVLDIRLMNSNTFVVLDDNPSNICMIAWTVLLKILGRRVLVWVEHIPDAAKSILKIAYQKGCSWTLAKMADAIMAFSEKTENYISSIGARARCFRMIQAVAFERCWTPKRIRKIYSIGFLGSAAPRKNVSTLIRAFQETNNPTLKLHLAGIVADDITTSSQGVKCWGYVEGAERERFFETIDLLILPSIGEPWGLVVNEALHRGCICAVSECCGSAEILSRIDRRLVFVPTVDGISACMMSLSNMNDVEIAEIRRKGDTLIKEYSLDVAAEKFIEILHLAGNEPR